jgi:transcriptional regulator with XRE-family HTH domain
MPAATPEITAAAAQQLVHLGAALRRARKAQRVNATAAAEAAGISRVTLHRIEKGEPTVAMGAWAAATEVLGLCLMAGSDRLPAPGPALPAQVRVDEYPELHKLAWQLQDAQALAPEEALRLYERNWRHVDRTKLTLKEIAFIRTLAEACGAGELLV